MAMARGVFPHHVSVALDNLGSVLSLGNKIENVLEDMKGVKEPTSQQLAALGEYCKQDVNIMWKALEILLPIFPKGELDLIDMTVRMYADPKAHGDMAMAKLDLQEQQEHKADLLAQAEKIAPGADIRKRLSSNLKFQNLIDDTGLAKCPTKWSIAQEKQVPALAKTDEGFLALQKSKHANIQTLCQARLAIKSTSVETRAIRFIHYAETGNIPIYLKMYGAHTQRWSGGDKFNPQNFKRGGRLRKAIIAPPGYMVMAIDSAQIECRTLAYIAGQQDLLELFADPNKDPYCDMASDMYGRKITKKDIKERFVGKIAVLGLGYGMGGPKFQSTLESGAMGMTVKMSLPEAEAVKHLYRKKNPKIVQFWQELEALLVSMLQGKTIHQYGLIFHPDRVEMPNSLSVHYPELQGIYNPDYGAYSNFSYRGKNSRVNLYGGKMAENLIQSIARLILAEQVLTLSKHYTVIMMVHDEGVFLVPESEIAEAEALGLQIFRRPPTWAKDIPLDAEVKTEKYYAK